MALNYDDLAGEYNDLLSDTVTTSSSFFEDNLRRFLEFIHDQQPFAQINLELSAAVPQEKFDEWYAAARRTTGGMVGSGHLDWPASRQEKLGMQLALFRHFLSARHEFTEFYLEFLGGSTRFDDMVLEIGQQLVAPFGREFERLARRQHEQLSSDSEVAYAPASDRIVRIDHNSAIFKQADDTLEKLEEAVRVSNSADLSPDDRERSVAEISAGRRLLKAITVKVYPITVLFIGVLGFLSNVEGVGQLAAQAWTFVKALLNL